MVTSRRKPNVSEVAGHGFQAAVRSFSILSAYMAVPSLHDQGGCHAWRCGVGVARRERRRAGYEGWGGRRQPSLEGRDVVDTGFLEILPCPFGLQAGGRQEVRKMEVQAVSTGPVWSMREHRQEERRAGRHGATGGLYKFRGIRSSATWCNTTQHRVKRTAERGRPSGEARRGGSACMERCPGMHTGSQALRRHTCLHRGFKGRTCLPQASGVNLPA